MNKNKWFLNGGRGSGKTFRLLWEIYENKIANLEKENTELEAENKKLRDSLKSDKICTCSIYLNFKDLEAELDRADKLLQRVIEWSEWQGSGCPRFNDIKDDIKAFLEEAHHD